MRASAVKRVACSISENGNRRNSYLCERALKSERPVRDCIAGAITASLNFSSPFCKTGIVPIELPPLRQRTDGIPALAKHFLRRYEAAFGKELDGFSAEAMQALLVYSWPGNVRELEHVVERAAVLAQDRTIQCSDFVLPKGEAHDAQQSLRYGEIN